MEGEILLIVLVIIAVFLAPIIMAVNSNSKIVNLSKDILHIKNYLKALKEGGVGLSDRPQEPPQNTELQELKQLIQKLTALVEQKDNKTQPEQPAAFDYSKWQPKRETLNPYAPSVSPAPMLQKA
jgi:hypothetical protein